MKRIVIAISVIAMAGTAGFVLASVSQADDQALALGTEIPAGSPAATRYSQPVTARWASTWARTVRPLITFTIPGTP
jgi:hypothetical protein